MRSLVRFVFFPIVLAACAGSPRLGIVPPDEAFILAATYPDYFDGKEVSLRGWITLRHEDWNLWATSADQEEWNTPRCISLSGYYSLRDEADEFDGRLVEVTGTILSDASLGGKVIRLGACRDVAIKISGPSSVKLVYGGD